MKRIPGKLRWWKVAVFWSPVIGKDAKRVTGKVYTNKSQIDMKRQVNLWTIKAYTAQYAKAMCVERAKQSFGMPNTLAQISDGQVSFMSRKQGLFSGIDKVKAEVV